MAAPLLSEQEVARFEQDGYLMVEGLLNEEEIELLQQTCRADDALRRAAMDVKDASGKRTNLTLWNHPGNDIYGMIARSERVVLRMQQLLDDEVYHYHTKLSAKEPKVGGAWEWHQDYGYWYNNGCLLPTMASMFLAIDEATIENGCLQVLRGSHRMGRINHDFVGEQTGADPERVELAKQRFELKYCEMAPGTGLFFHGNLLHRSDANLSDRPRWGLIHCYNTKTNDPLIKHHHPGYTPLEMVPDSAILEVGRTPIGQGVSFLVQNEDRTSRSIPD